MCSIHHLCNKKLSLGHVPYHIKWNKVLTNIKAKTSTFTHIPGLLGHFEMSGIEIEQIRIF